jgi:hypothetical protein
VLIALLLPAVQAARDAARRTQCIDNVKNIALGAINHVDTIGHFPSGGWGYRWVGDPDRGYDDRQPGGFFYNILPFIEQENLHEMGQGLGNGSPTNEKGKVLLKMIQTPIPVYTCPTRRPSKSFGVRTNRDWMYNTWKPGANRAGEDTGYGWFKTCYAASGGTTGAGMGAGPPSHEAGDKLGSGGITGSNGVGGARSAVMPQHIVDGLSNTYMCGEKNINATDYYSEEGADFGDDEPALGGDDMDMWKVGSCTNPPAQDEMGVYRSVSWGGPHPSVFTMAMCDGSVHLISYDIELEVHAANANREDEGTIPDCGLASNGGKPSRGGNQ